MKKINSSIPAEKAVGFEIYHFPFDASANPEMVNKYIEMGFMNHAPFGTSEYHKKMVDMGMKFWLYGHGFGTKDGVFHIFATEEKDGHTLYKLNDGWREKIAEFVDELKQNGYWDNVIGFDFDEPMSQSINDLVEEVCEEYAKYGKRIRAIFSTYELEEGGHPDSGNPLYNKKYDTEIHLINPKSCRFFTDIGFDVYGDAKYDYHKRYLEIMKKRVGRDDVNIWFVPCTWSFYNMFGQNHAIEHLETCYKLLLEQERPGGLTCYNWYSFQKVGESLDWIFSENNPARWTRLENRMIEIANEITNIPLK